MLEFLSLDPNGFGLDISDFSMKIAKLRKSGRNFKLVSFGEFPIKAGIIQDGEIKEKDALAKLIEKSLGSVKGEKIRTNQAVVSLPERRSFLEIIKLPLMEPEEIEQAIRYEIENYIPLAVKDAYWDFQIIQPFSKHLKHTNVLVAAIPKKAEDSYSAVLKQAGLKPLVFEVESTAIARALVPANAEAKQVLVLDLGATRTGFMIFSGSSLVCIFSIPVCGRIFDQAIAKEFDVTLEEAENLKKKYGLNQKIRIEIQNGLKKKLKPGRVFEAMIPALTDLSEQIQKYIDYYYTHIDLNSKAKKIDKVFLSGGGSYTEGLKDFLAERFELPVELGDPWINIVNGVSDRGSKKLLKKPLIYATVLGLALRGVKSKHNL